MTDTGNSGFPVARRNTSVENTREFYYDPDEDEALSVAVVSAIAGAHDEDITEQRWCISEGSNADGFDGLFQQNNLERTLQFERDSAAETIITDTRGQPFS